jgi:hypothetical protein
MVRYISIIFAIATLMGSMHHHDDMRTHTDCKVCMVQQNIVDIDTPIEIDYLTLFSRVSESTLVNLQILHIQKVNLAFSARAPPFYS